MAVAMAALCAVCAPAASANVWTRSSGRPAGAKVETAPSAFAARTLDRFALRAKLADATRHDPVTISIPAPDGTLQRFAAVDSPIMQAGLAAAHPEIQSFSATGIDDPSATARFDLTPLGFHASVRSDSGTWYVDPHYRDDTDNYVSYFTDALGNVHGPLAEPRLPPQERRRPRGVPSVQARAGDIVKQRVYRLALISDPMYATYFGSANVTAAKTVLMDRVNQVYNDDLAVKMVLINGTDSLNLDTDAKYHGALGPCGALPCYPAFPPPVDPSIPDPSTGNACDLQTITQNNVAINAILGDPTGASYDIGHIVLGRPGGGVASLGVVGDPTRKASGCTGIPTPKGDFFAVDYVAHEMGHEFGGDHTFNGTQLNCASGNRNEDTSVEPGSGSSVMAYAGICRQDNLQPHSDPYFSQRSIDEIQADITSDMGPGFTNQGNVVNTTTNHAPVVSAPAAKSIPIRTPFTLTGSGTDADGDTLVYDWEENDVGGTDGTALVNNAKPDGPLFRVFSAYAPVDAAGALLSPSPGENLATTDGNSRTFPDLVQIDAGNTNAATGTCPAVTLIADDQPAPPALDPAIIDCYAEFLPAVSRDMNFRLVARDRKANGGGVGTADVKITAAGTAPFRVTTPAAPMNLPGNSVLPLTWDVAGTAGAPVNTASVKISYSTDGGKTFPTVLAASTPNDGSEAVTIPETVTTTGRFKVEAVDNYFFDVSHADLTVTSPPVASVTPTPTATASASATATGTPAATGTPSVTPSPTASASPSATPTPGAEPSRLVAGLKATRKSVKVKPSRRLRIMVSCTVLGSGAAPTRCRGVVQLKRKGKVIAKRKFNVPTTGVARKRGLRLSPAVFAKLKGGPLKVKLVAVTQNDAASGGPALTKKRVKLHL